jgi:hypothetical protein
MTDLSPAAIAVDDALAACIQLQGEIIRARPLAAAALRAAADQVVPEDPPTFIDGGRSSEEQWMARVESSVRQQLLAIAAELEGSNA